MANRVIIINDAACKADLEAFLETHEDSIIHRSETVIPEELIEAMSQPQILLPKRLLINTVESLTMVSISEIVRCQSNRNYTEVFCRDGSKLLVSKTLKAFEEWLAGHPFFRIHKSHLINLPYLHRFVRAEGGTVELTDGSKLPVAVRKREALVQRLYQFRSSQ